MQKHSDVSGSQHHKYIGTCIVFSWLLGKCFPTCVEFCKGGMVCGPLHSLIDGGFLYFAFWFFFRKIIKKKRPFVNSKLLSSSSKSSIRGVEKIYHNWKFLPFPYRLFWICFKKCMYPLYLYCRDAVKRKFSLIF